MLAKDVVSFLSFSPARRSHLSPPSQAVGPIATAIAKWPVGPAGAASSTAWSMDSGNLVETISSRPQRLVKVARRHSTGGASFGGQRCPLRIALQLALARWSASQPVCSAGHEAHQAMPVRLAAPEPGPDLFVQAQPRARLMTNSSSMATAAAVLLGCNGAAEEQDGRGCQVVARVGAGER